MPASAKLRKTSASSPLVEADAPVCISLASKGCPIVLPGVLLDIEGCAGRSEIAAGCDAFSLLRPAGAAGSGCCIISVLLECLYGPNSLCLVPPAGSSKTIDKGSDAANIHASS